MTRTAFRGVLVLLADLVVDGAACAFDTLAERIEGVGFSTGHPGPCQYFRPMTMVVLVRCAREPRRQRRTALGPSPHGGRRAAA